LCLPFASWRENGTFCSGVSCNEYKKPAEEGFVSFRGYNIWYRIIGENEEPGKLPLICLHGGPGATHGYFELLEAVSTKKSAGGKSVWRAFWLGGDALGDNLTPQRPQTDHQSQMFWGVTVPWNLLVSALLGAWLMIAPDVFQTQGQAADSDHILGALVVTISIIAFAEVTRAARFINIALAFGMIVLPWLLGGATFASGINDLIIGVLIIALSIPPGKIKNTYGGWNALIV